jgi:choline dehydrogenase-like flavoprotein
VNYVIGSGPSGIAVTKALLNQGLKVTMLDAGQTLEPHRQDLLNRAANSTLELTPQNLLKLFKNEVTHKKQTGILPQKLAYGSDFAYGQNANCQFDPEKPVLTLSSHALGGLSNVWGSAILPYRPADISGWPITAQDLEPHYQAISNLMSISSVADDLEKQFPRFTKKNESLDMSQQAQMLLKDLERSHEALLNCGISFGKSRLAVNSEECTYCGLCLHGCPNELIFNTKLVVEELKEHPNFSYIPNFIVDTISENSHSVSIFGKKFNEAIQEIGERVYLACGTINSAFILLKSMGETTREFTIKDSQYFVIPLLRKATVKNIELEKLHTLAQIFLELKPFKSLSFPAHLQIYTYNDLYADLLRKKLGPLQALSKPIEALFLGRLLTIQGYLHSNDSSTIKANLVAINGDYKLNLRGDINPIARKAAYEIARLLQQNKKSINGHVISPLMQFGIPGQGSHIGGIFPMSRNPKPYEVDLMGRPLGYERLHIVDSSILPTIAAPTITFTVMANAHRIGSFYPTLN